MKRNAKRREGPGALALIEEAVHLLRVAPLGTLATYHAGALPFVLGLLYFWTDMSRNPFAHLHVMGAALGMGLLFLWLKFWQAVFAQKLRAQVTGEPAPALTFARACRIAYTQTALQPSALFLLPLALIPALPFPWLYAFYQNLTVQANADAPTLRAVAGKAWKPALLWPGQNHVLLSVMSLFGFFVFLSCSIAAIALPELLKMFFGIETVFTRSNLAMLNTTFFTTMACLTYLCVDPIMKAIYVLRVFHGESLASGDDLRAALRPFTHAASRLAACLFFVVMLAGTTRLNAGDNAPASAPPRENETIKPQELDRAISDVLQQRKYTWRQPRVKADEAEEGGPGVVAKFFQRLGRMIRNTMQAVGDWLEKVMRKIFGRTRTPASGGSGYGWIMTKQMLLYGLLAVVISAIAVLLLRLRKNRRGQAEVVTSQAIQPAPDLTDENVAADQLPEDGWTTLARELLARGEFRLALRAFYLASLAHLAERNLVSLAQFKSNRDYERELQRRAHAFPEVTTRFGENVSAFDRVWYGRHKASGELVTQFAANVDRIKAGG
jgi:Domain of unknown function (DUF4129)